MMVKSSRPLPIARKSSKTCVAIAPSSRGTPSCRAVVIANYQIGIGGDLIMAIDGKPVDRLDALSRALARKRPGDKVELTLFRNGKRVNVTVTLGEAPTL